MRLQPLFGTRHAHIYLVLYQWSGAQDYLIGIHKAQEFLSERPLEYSRFDGCDNGVNRNDFWRIEFQRDENVESLPATTLYQSVSNHEEAHKIVGGFSWPIDASRFLPNSRVHSILDPRCKAILRKLLPAVPHNLGQGSECTGRLDMALRQGYRPTLQQEWMGLYLPGRHDLWDSVRRGAQHALRPPRRTKTHQLWRDYVRQSIMRLHHHLPNDHQGRMGRPNVRLDRQWIAILCPHLLRQHHLHMRLLPPECDPGRAGGKHWRSK